MSARALSLLIVALFIGSIMTSLTSDLNQNQEQELEDLAVVSEATSPGHNVFLQYISSDNCYYCYTTGGGSESAHPSSLSSFTSSLGAGELILSMSSLLVGTSTSSLVRLCSICVRSPSQS